MIIISVPLTSYDHTNGNKSRTDSFPRLKLKLESIEGIGDCRAVWVPGQDLATPHMMCNCRKRILSLHCMLYVTSVHA